MSVLLVVAVCLQRVYGRRLALASQLDDNEISSNPSPFGMVSGRNRDWVRISESPYSVIGKVGSRVEFECEAMGSPAPVMQWLKGNMPLTEVNNQVVGLIRK